MSKRDLRIDADTDAILTRLARDREVQPLEELDRRWAEFERTGESYSQEEVEEWLKTWGTSDFRPFRRHK